MVLRCLSSDTPKMRELDGLSHVLSAERDWFLAFKVPPVMTVNLRIDQWIDILFILGRGSIARR